jgi:hypothetical protein
MKVTHISYISLPVIDNIAPGPIHSVCHDCEGNIYCSDEFNHRIISLNPKGGLRWARGEKGDRKSEFRYPRGISFGCVNHMGKTVSCVAVCDAWNYRVQIFGLDGDWLAEWTHAESEAFCEVVDIKSVCTVTGKKGTPDYWLILDRTGNRIFEFSPGGELRGHLGQVLPPLLEAKWAKTILENLKGTAGIESATEFVFDPLFYPTRLIGKAEDALFVWEPLTMRLKQLVGGCLFPLNLKMNQAWECMDATPNEFLCWIPSERCLALFDYQGKLRSKAACETRPIFADISLNQVWLQEKDGIVPIQLATHPQSSTTSEVSIPLLSNVETEISLLKADKTFQEIGRIFLENTGKLRSLCEQIWQLAKEPSPDAQICEFLQNQLTVAIKNLDPHVLQDEILSAHPMLLLKLHRLLRLMSGDANAAFSTISEICQKMAAPLIIEFLKILKFVDALAIYRTNIASINPDSHSGGIARKALNVVDNTLMATLRSLQSAVRSINIFPELRSPDSTPDSEHSLTGRPPEAANIGQFSHRTLPSVHGFLRELDRISLQDVLGRNCPTEPYGLTATSNGHVFVALRLAHCVLELDHEYKTLKTLGGGESIPDLLEPLCIAADSSDQLWITEYAKNSLNVCLPGAESSQFIPVIPDCPTPLRLPHGICKWHERQMLIADTLNNRILAISHTGMIEIIADGNGSNPGQFRHPAALVPSCSGENEAIWVVDARNHRVQKLDATGRFMLAAGCPGLGLGSLLLPFTAAVFSDGSLLVSQHLITSCLTLFTPDGKPMDRAFLDFAPGGLLTHRGYLLVTDVAGNCIRVFRRL